MLLDFQLVFDCHQALTLLIELDISKFVISLCPCGLPALLLFQNVQYFLLNQLPRPHQVTRTCTYKRAQMLNWCGLTRSRTGTHWKNRGPSGGAPSFLSLHESNQIVENWKSRTEMERWKMRKISHRTSLVELALRTKPRWWLATWRRQTTTSTCVTWPLLLFRLQKCRVR